MNNSICVSDVFVSYAGKSVLQNINFSIDTGKLVGIIGPNGAGKSTLMKAMLGLIPKDGGNITINGEPVARIRKQMAYVPQRTSIDFDFPITVLDTVVLGTYPSLTLFQRPTKKHKQWALDCLTTVNMEDFAHKQIGELSGGQQQRVFLARALAQRASLFFLDEPFVGIDVTSEAVIINVLKKLRDEGKSIIVVHHDLSKVKSYFDDVVIVNGEIVGAGAVRDVFIPSTLKKAFKAQASLWDAMGVSV